MQKLVIENLSMPKLPPVNIPNISISNLHTIPQISVSNLHEVRCPDSKNVIFVSHSATCTAPQKLQSCGTMNIKYYCK